MGNEKYNQWISLRESSKNDLCEKLCYCGHTYKCICADPDEKEFEDAVKRGDIKPDDKNNGWKSLK